jgi:regulator of nucleoside diphosphate kinase
MPTNRGSDRRIWMHDFHRLERVARSAYVSGLPVAGSLLSQLKQAVRHESDRPPSELVTLNSWVTFRLGHEDKTTECRLLVSPDDDFSHEANLSVLSPLGAALIGAEVGQSISYLDLEGVSRQATVQAVGVPNRDYRIEIEVGLCTLIILAAWSGLALRFAS